MIAGARIWVTVLVVLLDAPAAASSLKPTGVWLSGKKKVAIRIYDCGDQLCGRIVWLKKPLDKAGRLKRDENNPDLAARDRPLCGVAIVVGLEPREPGLWDGGTIYNPQDGQTYSGLIRIESEDTLKVRGYIGIPLLGKSETWTRMEEPADSCG